MDKISFDLPQAKWGTLKSKYKPETKYVTSDELTSGSYNFITNVDGTLTKRPTDVLYNNGDLSAVGKDQFEAIFANGVHHLLLMVNGTLSYTTGDRNVSAAKAGYTANANMEYSMYQNRVYFCNGVDNASVYDLTTSYGGVPYTFPSQTIKTMGCQTPGSVPSFGADTSGGAVPVGGHTYKVTFLYYGSEESNGGSVSILHTVTDPNQTVHLTSVPVGGYGVTARNIYRDNNDGNYLLVGTISDNTTTTYVDAVSSGTTPIPTSNNLPPVFSYIVLNLSRLWVAGVSGTPTTLYWSLPGLPDIFDPNNFVLCNPKDPIQGIYVYQGTTYVFNRHSFGRILGTTDDTFYYDEVPGSVGCVDNRSVQVRTINGVPTLIWLSDRGFYAFNGSSAEYISDSIEDIVNLNIQQVNFVSGSNAQSSQSDFEAGTATAGIDLDSDPGVITTLPISKSFQSRSDWDGGSSLTNVATADGSNQLKVPVHFAPIIPQGTLAGAAIRDASFSPERVRLSTVASQTIPQPSSEGNFLDIGGPQIHAPSAIAQKFQVQFNGTIPTITAYFGSNGFGGTVDYRLRVYNDALGTPGAVLYEQTGTYAQSLPQGSTSSVSIACNLAVSANTPYWFSIEEINHNFNWWIPANTVTQYPQQLLGIKRLVNGAWMTMAQAEAQFQHGGTVIGINAGATPVLLPCIIFFNQTPVASTGTWQSPVYDSFSTTATTASFKIASTGYPTSFGTTSIVVSIDRSNDATLSSGVTTNTYTNPTSTTSVALTGGRYWRIRYALSTPDNRETPSASAPILSFNTTGTWISPAIDCTADVTSYNPLVVTDNLPAGTTVALTIATSTDNVTYSSYTSVPSAVVHRYVKIKAVLTTTTDNANTPSISLLTFSWNLSSTFTSSIINVGQVPSGWGLFQDVSAPGSGTITFYMRSASSSGGISSASFYQVTNGNFPDPGILPHQYVQWKAVLTAVPGTLPTIDSVTINWFLGNNQSPLRTASLFFNKTYYLAAAENNQTTNNVVILLDFENNWRIFRDININSLGLFFNQPFYLDAVRPDIYQWLVEPTGTGSSIMMDVRTKAFDMGDIDRLKTVRSLRVTGINTGTTIHAYYSVDRGTTWHEMLNSSGTTGYATTSDGNKFSEYFVPDFSQAIPFSGNTAIFRVTSSDALPCSIISLKPSLYVHKGKYLGRAI